MAEPQSTGGVASLLRVLEPKLNDLIRRGKIDPAPPVVAGRRLWNRTHILQAARHLGVLTEALKAELNKGVSRV